jgi:hypothetical protein
MYVLIIVIGCGHGLVLLPVILSLLGPASVTENKPLLVAKGVTDSSTQDAIPLKPVRTAFT